MSNSQPSTETVEAKPWRYIGYRGFAEFTASDHDFFILRRFDSLTARVLLRRQWKLVKTEKELATLDYQRSHAAEQDYNNGSFESDCPDRQYCLGQAEVQLEQYYKLLNEYSLLRNKPKASFESIQSIKNWLYRWDDRAINREECSYLNEDADLFAIVETPRTPLRRVLEKSNLFRDRRIFQRNRNRQGDSEPHLTEHTVYQNDKRLDTFVNAIVCIVGFLMLVSPLWILLNVSTYVHQLAVITVFIAVFLALVQSVAVAKPFESLAATAAYSAVLMVFMQIGTHTS